LDTSAQEVAHGCSVPAPFRPKDNQAPHNSGATVVQEVEKSFSNQKVVSLIPCRSVLEQDTSFFSSFPSSLFFPSFTLLSKIVMNIHFPLVSQSLEESASLLAAIFIIIIIIIIIILILIFF